MTRRRLAVRAQALRSGLYVLLTACAGADDPAGVDTDPHTDVADSDVAVAPHLLANTCVEYAAIAATLVPWDTLANPLVSRPDESLSDVSVRFTVGQWHLFASRRSGATDRQDVAHLVSVDTVRWELAGSIDLPTTAGLRGPDLTRDDDGRFMLTASTVDGRDGVAPGAQVWWSDDLSAWAGPQRLDPRPDADVGGLPVDVTLGHAAVGLVAMWTDAGRTRLAVSTTRALGGPWTEVEVELPVRAGRFLRLDDAWHVLGARRSDGAPTLLRLTGDEEVVEGWSTWETRATPSVAQAGWNSAVAASGATLCDARGLDGFAYLFHAGWGAGAAPGAPGAIGLARSRDLITWEAPGPGVAPRATEAEPSRR